MRAQEGEITRLTAGELGPVDAIGGRGRPVETFVWSGDDLVEPEWVVSVVNAEGRIHDGQDHLQLQSGRRARLPIGAGDGANIFVE